MTRLHWNDGLRVVRLFGKRYQWTIRDGRYVLAAVLWPERLDKELGL